MRPSTKQKRRRPSEKSDADLSVMADCGGLWKTWKVTVRDHNRILQNVSQWTEPTAEDNREPWPQAAGRS